MSDRFEIVEPKIHHSDTPTAWLLELAIQSLNVAGEDGVRAYGHAVELLRERDDAVEIVQTLSRRTPVEDVGRRWSALYVLGDIGDERAAEQLAHAALDSLPDHVEDTCESARDGELLLRVMAVESLHKIAERHDHAQELLLRIVEEQPARPVLIEAAKAAKALDLTDKVAKMLSKDQQWILDIDVVPAEKISVEVGPRDEDVVGRAPDFDVRRPTPTVECGPRVRS